ncbi:hypothetical protein FG475_15055 [Vibrio navarrensis]|uniref:hypothetical protein n=1 Tax=Vibrio navarrensis TaxID=29495 RepID=UPI0018DD3A22|nr:hypothetical protein [Vibrio navarrensis]EHA1126437.1 hypothetical protein [Vibrio navarrensis]MBH9740008.1 hypothetical protein [Vibrio navarrensis]HDY8121347.1 hypothetical protein [Vibrio vulnificus]
MGDFYEKSDLPPSGSTFTNSALHKTAKAIIGKARELFGSTPVSVHLWAYRRSEDEYLSCDFFVTDNLKLTMPITISIADEADFEVWDEPIVVDMTEAIHLSGLLISALNAHVFVGRHDNEINESLLAVPLNEGETNGSIDLA